VVLAVGTTNDSDSSSDDEPIKAPTELLVEVNCYVTIVGNHVRQMWFCLLVLLTTVTPVLMMSPLRHLPSY